jgi:hypothetical protein
MARRLAISVAVVVRVTCAAYGCSSLDITEENREVCARYPEWPTSAYVLPYGVGDRAVTSPYSIRVVFRLHGQANQ